eukprot:TRINITY_DN373_c0_g2_i2.p1 TRINITY_DN373_c0_g2~~TRINITY_DN373_c0_g2_i2.p1  ORF type:complete len:276 (-),score=34.92 TRINITY_DN373_c0_g2_i2:84-911(-)
MGLEGAKNALRVFGQYWAYSCAIFLCFVIFVLAFISIFVPWYKDSYEGTFSVQFLNGTEADIYLDWSILEYYTYLEVNLGSSLTCHYDGICDLQDASDISLPELQEWDLTEYRHNYAASLTFLILALIVDVLMFPLLIILMKKGSGLGFKPTLILLLILVGLNIALFVFLVIAWSVPMGHPHMAKKSLDKDDDFCDFYSHNQAGVLCSWKGSQKVYDSEKFKGRYKYLVFPTRMKVINYEERWGPREGWVLNSVTMGLSIYVLILVVGWRPALEV